MIISTIPFNQVGVILSLSIEVDPSWWLQYGLGGIVSARKGLAR
jgi:hypothetical protein